MSSAIVETQPATARALSTQWSPVTAVWRSPAWLVDAMATLGRLARLTPTHEDECPPMRAAIESAGRVLSEMERYIELPPVHIGPSSAGGLGFELRCGPRDLDLDIHPNGAIEYLKATRTGAGFDMDCMEDGVIRLDNLRELRPLINWLMTGVS